MLRGCVPIVFWMSLGALSACAADRPPAAVGPSHPATGVVADLARQSSQDLADYECRESGTAVLCTPLGGGSDGRSQSSVAIRRQAPDPGSVRCNSVTNDDIRVFFGPGGATEEVACALSETSGMMVSFVQPAGGGAPPPFDIRRFADLYWQAFFHSE